MRLTLPTHPVSGVALGGMNIGPEALAAMLGDTSAKA